MDLTRISQRRAVINDRRRLVEQGMNRYEVRGLVIDKELVREIARGLAVGGTAATRLRAELAQKVAAGPTRRGGVFDSLHRSPLVGAELSVKREVSRGRRDLEAWFHGPDGPQALFRERVARSNLK